MDREMNGRPAVTTAARSGDPRRTGAWPPHPRPSPARGEGRAGRGENSVIERNADYQEGPHDRKRTAAPHGGAFRLRTAERAAGTGGSNRKGRLPRRVLLVPVAGRDGK